MRTESSERKMAFVSQGRHAGLSPVSFRLFNVLQLSKIQIQGAASLPTPHPPHTHQPPTPLAVPDLGRRHWVRRNLLPIFK